VQVRQVKVLVGRNRLGGTPQVLSLSLEVPAFG